MFNINLLKTGIGNRVNSVRRMSLRARQIGVASVAGIVLAEGAVLAQQHQAVHTSHDSFMHFQVDTTDKLVKALQNDPALRKTYARHFHMPESQVVDFVKRTLIPYRLPAGRKVTNYGITRNGTIYPVSTYLKKGTEVWATRSGLPILKWDCSNPLTNHLPIAIPNPRMASVQHGKKPTAKRLASVDAPELPSGSKPKRLAEVSIPEMTPPEAVDTSAIKFPPNLGGASEAVVPAVNAVQIPAAAGGAGFLPFIPLLAGVATLHGGGGAGTNGGGTVTAVAEPGSAALTLLAGLPIAGGLLARRRK